MQTLVNPKNVVMVLLLAAAMLATRFHHFGSVVNLPDASLAVFFLVGFYLRSFLFLPIFLVEAGLIDYATISGGVSDWCVSPAYFFLIPTYASLWLAGRWYAQRHAAAWRTVAPLAAALCVGTSVAFLISNSSFYLLSGYFGTMSPGEYTGQVAQYYPPYVAMTVFYVAMAAGLHLLTAAAAKGAMRSRPEQE
jgi:hypothetical protein